MKKIIDFVLDKCPKRFVQFIKFNLVGIINTIITFIIFTILNKGFNIEHKVSESIGYTFGLINSYFMNKIWTFGKKQNYKPLEVIKFILINMIALGGTLLILDTTKNILKIDVLWGKLFGYCFSVPVNFLGFKYWVFRRNDEKKAQE